MKDFQGRNVLAIRLGRYAAIATSGLTLITFGIALFTPPLSGPNCVSDCYTYPYTDIASRFPRDYLWMYPAMVLSLVFYVLTACVHAAAVEERKIFSQIGSAFALISTAVLVVDYFVQVSVVQPSLLQGETDGIPLLTQFNPHGLFIVLEEIGFTMMSLALLFIASSITGSTKVDTAIRSIFIASFVLTIASLLYFSLQFGIGREYRYEVAAISINWLALLAGGILLAIRFGRQGALAQPMRKDQGPV